MEVIDVDHPNSNIDDNANVNSSTGVLAEAHTPTAPSMEDTEAATTTPMPSPLKPRQSTQSPSLVLLLLNINAFQLSGRRGMGTKAAVRKAKSRDVTSIIKAVFDPLYTKEQQQVLALREAVSCKDMYVHSANAGLLLNTNKLFFYLLSNIKVITMATTKTKKRGKPSDYLRLFLLVHTIVLAMLPTPGSTRQDSSREIAKCWDSMKQPTGRQRR